MAKFSAKLVANFRRSLAGDFRASFAGKIVRSIFHQDSTANFTIKLHYEVLGCGGPSNLALESGPNPSRLIWPRRRDRPQTGQNFCTTGKSSQKNKQYHFHNHTRWTAFSDIFYFLLIKWGGKGGGRGTAKGRGVRFLNENPKNIRKLRFQPLWTILDIFPTFFGPFLSTFPFSGLSNDLPVRRQTVPFSQP